MNEAQVERLYTQERAIDASARVREGLQDTRAYNLFVTRVMHHALNLLSAVAE